MSIQELADEIKGNLSTLLTAEVSIAFVKENAGIVYLDDGIKEFESFITNFSSENFKLLNIYDHSLPLSGTKLGFFKTSPTSLIVIYSHGDGPVGQLLVFKSRIDMFASKIDEILLTAEGKPQVEEKPIEESIPPSAQRIPTIPDKFRKKKYTMEEATVIHNIDGVRTIAEICKITEIPLLKVNEIIKKYEKKKYIKLKRIIAETIIPKKESPIDLERIKPIPSVQQGSQNIQFLGKKEEISEISVPESISSSVPFSDKIVIEEKQEISPEIKEEIVEEEPRVSLDYQSNEIFPIFDSSGSKASKNELFYLELCDGRNTINDIIEITKIERNNLFKIFKKYQKKDGLKLLRFIAQDHIRFTPTETIPEVKEETKPKIEAPPKEIPVTQKVTTGADILQDLSDDLSELDFGGEGLDELNLPQAEPEKIESLELPQIEGEPEVSSDSSELDSDLDILNTELDLDDKVEDTISELSSLIDDSGASEGDEAVVFEDALSELDQLIDEATEAVADVEPISVEDYSKPIEDPIPLEDSISVEDKLKQYDASYGNTTSETFEVPIPADEAPIEAIFSNKVTCGMCGSEFPASRRLCPSCKKPAMNCPNCGQPVAVIAKICPYCTNLISR